MIRTGTLFLNNFAQNEIIKWVHHIHQSVKNWNLITEVGYNKCKISGSQQCILGQAKLVMVLVQLTLWKIIIHDFSIYFRQSTWQCQDGQQHFAPISLKWDNHVKYKQFDFSLLANGKSIGRKVHFPQYYNSCWKSCFISNLKWRGCFYLGFKFFCYIIVSMGRGRGSNKLSQKEGLPQAQNPINFTECFWLRKGFSFICILYV